MNFAEELAYWYLRFNGFFAITNYVLHRYTDEGTLEKHMSSDTDILGLRTPHVFEEIGGHSYDWDDPVSKYFDTDRICGVVCEVKAGRYETGELLESKHVRRAVNRLGFGPISQEDLETLDSFHEVDIGENFRVFKLLIANTPPKGDLPFVSLQDARSFIKRRIREYNQKYSDWVLFKSNIMQEIIWEVQQEKGKRK